MALAINSVTFDRDHGHHGDHGHGGHDDHGTSVRAYTDGLMGRFDTNRDGRIDRREQVAAGDRAREFFRAADENHHGGHEFGIDRSDIERAVSFRIDRNRDGFIDGEEQRAAAIDFGF